MGGNLQRKHVVVSGIRLAYLERAPALPSAKPPLVLLHGLLATADTFAEMIAGLPTDRRIVALDLLSAESEDRQQVIGVDFASLSKLIAGFFAAVKAERPVLLGHSHGGVLALQLAAFREAELSGLILLCPAHPFAGYHAHVVRFYLTLFGRNLALVATFAPRMLLSKAYTRVTGPGHRLTKAQFDPYLRVYRDRRKVRRILRLLESWEADMAVLGERMDALPITTPMLVAWGDQDPIVEIQTAEALQERLPGCDRVTVPGAGHLLAEEAPGEVAEHIDAWLNQRGL